MLRIRRGVLVFAAVLVAGLGFGGEPASPNAEALASASGLPSGWLAIQSDAIVRVFNSSTAELYADLLQTSVTAQRTFARAIPSIVDYSQTAHATADAGVDATNALASLYPSYCGPDKKWVMWDTPFLVSETRKRDDGYLGYKQTISGFATGISRMLGDTSAIGLAVGYDGRKLTGRDGYHWREKADAFHAALYGGTAVGCFFVDAYAGYSRDWQRTERYVNDWDAPATSNVDINKGNYNNTVLSAGIKASYVWILPSEFRITPAIGLDFSHVRMGSFAEDGWSSAGAASRSRLAVDKSSYNSLIMPLTVSANKTFAASFLTFGGYQSLWTPEVRAGWVPQFGSKSAKVNSAFDYPGFNGANPGPVPFTSKSSPLADSYGTVGAGLKIKLGGKYVFAVDYDYTFADKYSNHTLTGTYGVCF